MQRADSFATGSLLCYNIKSDRYTSDIIKEY